MLATRDIEKGEEVLVDRAYTWSVDQRGAADTCMRCLQEKILENGQWFAYIRCKDCSRVWYCSDRCQAADSVLHDGLECRILNGMNLNDYQGSSWAITELRVVLRTLIRKRLEFHANDNYTLERWGLWEPVQRFDDYLLLTEHKNENSQLVIETTRFWQSEWLSALCNWAGLKTDPDEIESILYRFRCNAFEIADGVAVFLRGSFFNHNCSPNVRVTKKNKKQKTNPPKQPHVPAFP
jgi:hypothetical protein